jgi:regulator of protease activity HflC (stomatin/prohibitin superfamily)
MKEEISDFKVFMIITVPLVFILGAAVLCWPLWSIYQQNMAGKAELARAESNRKIKTLEASAEKDSAVFLSEAEVLRAKGVAKANKIIGDSLSNNEGYLRYLWIQNLKTNKKEVIYVPTEANLPILEASRLKKENK